MSGSISHSYCTFYLPCTNSVLCVVGDFCSHVSSNLFSIGKYPFFIYEIKHKNSPRKRKKALKNQGFSRRYLFYSPFLGAEAGFELPSKVLEGAVYRFSFLPSGYRFAPLLSHSRLTSPITNCFVTLLALRRKLRRKQYSIVFSVASQRATLVGL